MVSLVRSLACKNRPKHACQYCGKMIGHGNLKEHEQKCYRENFCKRDLLQADSIYCKYYNKIIQKRTDEPIIDGYKKRHHIKPKCIGGSNDSSNLVNLTAREHYICHLLLCKIYNKNEALHRAFMRMSKDERKQYISSRHYEEMKNEYAKFQSNKMHKNNFMAGKTWVNDGINNKPIPKNELNKFLMLGFKKGRVIETSNIKNRKNRIYMHKNNKRKAVTPEQIFEFLDNGWNLGLYETEGKKFTITKSGYKTVISRSSIPVMEKLGWVVLNFKHRSEQRKQKETRGLPKHRPAGLYKLLNNNIVQRVIHVNEIDEYIKQGWMLGGIKGLKIRKDKS